LVLVMASMIQKSSVSAGKVSGFCPLLFLYMR
jgi:hypothetical protein